MLRIRNAIGFGNTKIGPLDPIEEFLVLDGELSVIPTRNLLVAAGTDLPVRAYFAQVATKAESLLAMAGAASKRGQKPEEAPLPSAKLGIKS